MIRFFLTSVLCIVFFMAVLAQTSPTITQSFLVIKGKAESPVEQKHIDNITQIISSMLAQNSSSTNAPFSNFGLMATVNLLDDAKVEGVKTMVAAKLNVNIMVKNIISSENLGAFDIITTGSGKNNSDAINKAVQNLRNKKVQFTKELMSYDQKIESYYKDNCEKIITKSKDLVAKNELNAALSLLHGIPTETACYELASSLKLEVFAKTQQQICENVLIKSDAQIAANNFATALTLLSQIDASAPCVPAVKSKIADIEIKLDAAQKEQWEWLLKFWSEGKEAEKAKWNAYTAICLNWLKNNNNINFFEK